MVGMPGDGEAWLGVGALVASGAVLIATSAVLLIMCAICRRYTLDFTRYDSNNTQIIYNRSAGAKELPSLYTMGEYRTYRQDVQPYQTQAGRPYIISNPATAAQSSVADQSTNMNQPYIVRNHSTTEHTQQEYQEDCSVSGFDKDNDGVGFSNVGFAAEQSYFADSEDNADVIPRTFFEEDDDNDGLNYRNEHFTHQSP